MAGGSGVDASRRRARRATTALIAIACLAALAGLIQLGVWAASRDQLKTGPKRDAPRSSPLAVVISPTQHPLSVDKSRRTLTHLHGNGSRRVAVRATGAWYMSFECITGSGQVTLVLPSETPRGSIAYSGIRCGFGSVGPARETGAVLRVIANKGQHWELLVQQAR